MQHKSQPSLWVNASLPARHLAGCSQFYTAFVGLPACPARKARLSDHI